MIKHRFHVFFLHSLLQYYYWEYYGLVSIWYFSVHRPRITPLCSVGEGQVGGAAHWRVWPLVLWHICKITIPSFSKESQIGFKDGVLVNSNESTILVRNLLQQNTFRFGCRPPIYLFAHQSVLAVVHSSRLMLRIACRKTETLVWLCEAVILLGLVQESLVQYDNYDGMPPAESTSPHYASNWTDWWWWFHHSKPT